MLLHVLHETHYDYVPVVKTAQHMAHLQPAESATQRLLRHELDIQPRPEQRGETTDVYGNKRTFFSLRRAHKALKVSARSVIETSQPAPLACSLPWEAARECLRYHRGASWDPAAEFVFALSFTSDDPF